MKKTLKIALMLCIVASMMFASISSVFAAKYDVEVTNFQQLLGSFVNLSKGDNVNIYIKNNIDIESTIEVDVPCKVNIYGPATLNTFGVQVFYLDDDNIELYFHDVTIKDTSDTEDRYAYMDDGEAFYVNGSNCIIDGVRMEHCGSQNYGPTSNTFFDPIANAFYSWNGGAIYINGWENKILNCYFYSCRSQDDGGAICIYYDDQLIQDCTFEGCRAESDGGAIYCCAGVDDVVVNRCNFIDCGFDDTEYGKNVYGRDDTIVAGVPQDQRIDKLFYRCSFQDTYTASMFSTGSIIIIAAVTVIAIAAIIFFVKKKNPAAQI